MPCTQYEMVYVVFVVLHTVVVYYDNIFILAHTIAHAHATCIHNILENALAEYGMSLPMSRTNLISQDPGHTSSSWPEASGLPFNIILRCLGAHLNACGKTDLSDAERIQYARKLDKLMTYCRASHLRDRAGSISITASQ